MRVTLEKKYSNISKSDLLKIINQNLIKTKKVLFSLISEKEFWKNNFHIRWNNFSSITHWNGKAIDITNPNNPAKLFKLFIDLYGNKNCRVGLCISKSRNLQHLHFDIHTNYIHATSTDWVSYSGWNQNISNLKLREGNGTTDRNSLNCHNFLENNYYNGIPLKKCRVIKKFPPDNIYSKPYSLSFCKKRMKYKGRIPLKLNRTTNGIKNILKNEYFILIAVISVLFILSHKQVNQQLKRRKIIWVNQ